MHHRDVLFSPTSATTPTDCHDFESAAKCHDTRACGARATIGKVQFRYNREWCGGLSVMAREGIEPPTRGFSVQFGPDPK
jgi:hypothetical protein